jgi:hypothetical protein
MTFHGLERIADAVLFEGYLLYPYRASAAKNVMRWQFGVLAPRSPRDEDGEPWFSQTECLLEAGPGGRLALRVRFLRPQPAAADTAAPGWQEGVPHAIDLEAVSLTSLPINRVVTLPTPGLAARVVIDAQAIDAFVKVRIRLENLEPWRPEFGATRDAMLERSLVAAHLLLAAEDAAFVSLLEPGESAAPLAAGCANLHTWPVLAGDRPGRDCMLSSPIVLYDYPAVAAESHGDLHDGAEIEEILSLRILAMTDEEKQEARATDRRARRIIDRVDGMPAAALARLHGAMRSADFFNPPGTPPPEEAWVMVAGTRVDRGAHVRLRPTRRADAMDMFLRDRPATVAGVYRDVDDRVYVAVTVDADPAASLHASFGRFFYFDPDELEPIAQDPARAARAPDRQEEP